MKRHARPRDFRTVQSQNGAEPEPPAFEDLHARVSVVAYAFYERRGREDGHDVEDWIQAENIVREEMASRQNGGRTLKAL